MKVKKVKIGIRSLKDVFADVADTVKRLEGGEKLNAVSGPEIYFTSFEGIRKALTPKRLELLHVIKTEHPASIFELARMAKRNIKNVTEDVKYLERIGLIELEKDKRKMAPVIGYDKIAFEVAI